MNTNTTYVLGVLLIGVAIFVCTSFISCQSTGKPDVISLKQDIVYFKDYKTQLCFAAIYSDVQSTWKVISITQVPCTPEVLAEIEKQEHSK